MCVSVCVCGCLHSDLAVWLKSTGAWVTLLLDAPGEAPSLHPNLAGQATPGVFSCVQIYHTLLLPLSTVVLSLRCQVCRLRKRRELHRRVLPSSGVLLVVYSSALPLERTQCFRSPL